jgi:hypothetical protein
MEGVTAKSASVWQQKIGEAKMTKDELKLAFQKAFQMGQDYWYYADHEFESYNKKSDAIRAKFNEMVKETIEEALANEALEKMAENARELGLDYEPEPVPVAVVRWNDIGHISWRTHVMLSDDTPLYTTPPQRTWVGLTPACPQGLTQYECEVEGVDLVCFLEYTPDEEGSLNSYGLLNEPGTYENFELVNAYVKGTDVDIGHLLLQYLVDHITTTALEDLKNDDL